MNHALAIELSIVAAYVAVLVSIGIFFARRQTSTDTYFVASRSVPGWAMGMSMFATIITAVTVIAYPGASYAGNWSLLVPGFMVLGVLAVAGAIIIPFFRHAVGMSAYEYFGKRFGTGARVYSSLAFAAGHFSKMGVVLYLLGLTVGSMTGWSVYAIICVVGTATILYTLIGGMQAVVWTDVVQGIVLWLGIFIVLAYLWMLTPGGARAAIALAAANHKFSLGSMSLSLSKPTVLVLCLYGFFFYLQKYTADQTLVQRYLIARTDREALRGVGLGALLCVPVWALFMLIGTLLWAFYRLSGEALPAGLKKADQIFPYFLSTHVSPVFTGLFLAALFGAAMSSMASDLNCIAVVGVEDFFRRLRPDATDAKALRIGKAMVAVFGVFTIIFAVELAGSKGTALSLYFTITSIVAGGLAGLFLLAFLCPRANPRGAWVGIVLSLLVTAWATLTLDHGSVVNLGRWNYPLNSYMIGVIGHVVLFVAGYVASLVLPGDGSRELTLWGWLNHRRETALAEAVTEKAAGRLTGTF